MSIFRKYYNHPIIINPVKNFFFNQSKFFLFWSDCMVNDYWNHSGKIIYVCTEVLAASCCENHRKK